MTFQTNRLKHIGENNTEEMAGTDSKKIAKQMLNLRVKMRATYHNGAERISAFKDPSS